jgi:hypothetical protein
MQSRSRLQVLHSIRSANGLEVVSARSTANLSRVSVSTIRRHLQSTRSCRCADESQSAFPQRGPPLSAPAIAANRSGGAPLPTTRSCRRQSAGRYPFRIQLPFASPHLRNATAVQTASTMPNGHVPAKKPYADDAAHALANKRTNARERSSSAYAISIVETEIRPKRVRMLTDSV